MNTNAHGFNWCLNARGAPHTWWPIRYMRVFALQLDNFQS